MLAAAAGNPAAVRQEYNLTTDRFVTFEGIVQTIAKLAGKEAKICLYDPRTVDVDKKQAFPFRPQHFVASAAKARVELGWEPKHRFVEDMKECLVRYNASGRAEKEMDFSADDKCIKASTRTYLIS